MQTLLLVFLIFLLGKTLFEYYLNLLNQRHVEAHGNGVPEAFRETMDEDTYKRSIRYTQARLKFSRFENVFQAVLLALVLGTGFLAWLYPELTEILGTGVWGQAAVLFTIGVLFHIPHLPLDYYEQFGLEAQFGFNKSTKGLWVTDQIKGFLLNAVLMIPLIALLLAMVSRFPDFWWLLGFGVFFGFMLLMMVLYPMLILPLFNKLEPLKDSHLRERLMSLAEKAKFHARTIQVIDGSKRSAHSNAYFTGFGKFRRIVLFDTLIEQLDAEELEAVLAHEIGHYRLGHIPKMLAISGISGLFAFGVIAWLAGRPWFLTGFGFDPDLGIAAVFLLFGLVSGVITFWFSPLTARLSRKHEYEADQFARDVIGSDKPMIGALRKLSEKNLTNLTPHPLYSAWYYSHPTLLERERSLREGAEQATS